MTSTGQPLDETSARVALAVLRHGPVSRADLCRRLGLSAPTLTRLTGPMVASGLLVEGGPLATSGTGRPSLPLVVAGASGHLVGVKVVPGRLHAVLLDLTATVIDRRTVDGTWSTPEDAVHAIAAVTRDWADRPLKGLGVSLAATVVGEQTSPSELLGWPASPLAGLLRQATGLPVVVDNDVFALTVAEHWFGLGRDTRDLAVVTIGAGLGIGLVSDDELLHGHTGRPGRLGALRLADGRLARDVLTTAAVAGRLSKVLGSPVPDRDVDEALGEPGALAVRRDVSVALAEVVGQIVELFDPQRVVIAGEGVAWLEGVHEPLPELGSLAGRVTEVVIAEHGFDDWAHGAGCLAIREYMTRWVTGASQDVGVPSATT